ncbi:hypothetical protein CONPUDRAFT_107917 [Coniophora puteana RWD-64-598 SS2]|uniref:HMG box domain-containing protein n=1 Tax=Coniophora puteana (strain RWD-64-598) TaxID=741705 RepID=A0A5M3MFY4_CONPW|nr:uncharacterized protein CONPUDRAFT_107917 [Coniophora puteana RWD-64-598 SS2]EIW78169.1 hypothetical protein CONPUDRAFT_107917 [Coniophora puteana RWD-64-598 SS2]
MSASRLSHRRRSSMALSGFHPIKAGVYGINTSSPRNVTFAPNVTPVTYVEEPEDDATTPEDDDTKPRLFPPSEAPNAPPARRRVPPGKRRGSSYIPRPPNAFMLFRADFVRQKHVPGSIETNHGSLSKIIGNCWRNLPLDEKRVWEIRAKEEKKQHKIKYPNYRFRPVHNKNKPKKKDKALPTFQDEAQCDAITQLLLEGNKGEQLAERWREVKSPMHPGIAMPVPLHYSHRRSSSVPLPEGYFNQNSIAIPSVPFDFHYSTSNPDSPQAGMSSNHFGFGAGQRYSISQQNRMLLGQRRASSAGPLGKPYQQMQGYEYNNMHFDPNSLNPGWAAWGQSYAPSETNGSELDLPPQVDTTIFSSDFSLGGQQPFGGDMMSGMDAMGHSPMESMGPMAYPPMVNAHSPGVYDGIAPHDMPVNQQFDMSLYPPTDASKFPSAQHLNMSELPQPSAWPTDFTTPQSEPSSAYSGSPAASDDIPPHVHAPHPHHAVPAEMWGDASASHVHFQAQQHPQDGTFGGISNEAQLQMDGFVEGMFDQMAPHAVSPYHQFGGGFDELQATF